jgi:hypothetical protein
MRRRNFITVLGGTTAAWSMRAVAQTAAKVYRVGLLGSGAPITDNSPFGAPLIRGLAQRGYALDRNLAFERRAAEGHKDRLPQFLAELIAS